MKTTARPNSNTLYKYSRTKTKKFVDQHNYHVMKQGKVQDTHENDRYIGLYSTIEQQVSTDTMLSR